MLEIVGGPAELERVKQCVAGQRAPTLFFENRAFLFSDQPESTRRALDALQLSLDVRQRRSSLEDVFLKLTGHRLRAGE